jgi:hypothetical protein
MSAKLKRLAARDTNVWRANVAIRELSKINPDRLRDAIEQAGLRSEESCKLFALADAAAAFDELQFEQRCRVCGCTQNNCERCVEKTGGSCCWVEDDLCSACATDLAAKAPRRKSKGAHHA